jgi:predicted transcriptional regulator
LKRIFHFREASSQLGPLEQRVLAALWDRGTPVTVRDLIESSCRDLAYTTVMTTLDRLFKKNLLTRELEGRAFHYAPAVTREELHRQAACAALRQALDSTSAAALPLSYLVDVVSEHDAKLLDDLQTLVNAKRRELREAHSRSSDPKNAGWKDKR